MTGGTHVASEECAEIRRRREAGWAATMIAREMDVDKATVHYHLHGHCAHDHE